MNTFSDSIKKEWESIITNTSIQIRNIAADFALKQAKKLSVIFYMNISKNQDCKFFLANMQVEQRLKKSFERWIQSVLLLNNSSIDELINLQQNVGSMHARIGIPIDLVLAGMRVLKTAIYELVQVCKIEERNKLDLLIFIISSMDIALEVMMLTFTHNEANVNREDQNFRMLNLLEHAEEEKEKQISNLLSWETDIIYKVMVDLNPEGVRLISKSEFGLWFNHKGRYFFSGQAEVGFILKLIVELDELVINTQKNSRALSKHSYRVIFIEQIKDILSQINTYLHTLFGDMNRQEVGVDPLTRLLNRRFLSVILKREISHSIRNNTQLSVFLIDVDKFKLINDTYGHLFGDEVLRKISSVFYTVIRSSDYIFRYGGDEFLIVMTEVESSSVKKIADRIIEKVNQLTLGAPDKSLIKVTLSIGIAFFDGHPDFERFVNLADQALYKAKQNGRNRVEVFSPS